jgi:integrase
MRDDMWKGCVSADRNGWLAIKIKVDGKWRYKSTGLKDSPENRAKAERILAEVRDGMHAKAAAMRGAPGPMTVRAWSKKWLDGRSAIGLADWENDRARLDLHVLPVIGTYELGEVRPRHILEVVNRLRATGHAPRTVYNVYSVTKAMFRDAAIADLVPVAGNPCILTHRQLGKIRDKRPGWRSSAVYTREELAALVWDERLPLARRVLWALHGVGMLRAGEVAGLRWERLDLGAEPLGRIAVVTSYDHDKTKTETERWMPMHPAIAPLLAEWRLSGWARTYGRTPDPGDLVVPVPPEPRRKGRVRAVATMLNKGKSSPRPVLRCMRTAMPQELVYGAARSS